MSILTSIKILYLKAIKSHVIPSRGEYIFLLSHMRSRSSVLSHVLGSNNAILGYSELHGSYRSHTDLMKMKLSLYKEFNCDLNDKFYFDKLLHNSNIISNKLFKDIQPKTIFLIRDAQSSIKSMINMGFITGVKWYKSPQKAMNYYCKRLAFLNRLSKKIKGQYFFIESNDLVDKTDIVLSNLTAFLNLTEPLTNRYFIFNNTGQSGYGDPSNNIEMGVIKKTEGYDDIEIPKHILEKAEIAYDQCVKTLKEHSILDKT